MQRAVLNHVPLHNSKYKQLRADRRRRCDDLSEAILLTAFGVLPSRARSDGLLS